MIAGAVAALLVCEVSLRIKAYFDDQKLLSQALKNPVALPPGAPFSLLRLMQPSPNQRIIYELRPNLSGIFADAVMTTNGAGFRGPLYAPEKASDAVRIVAVGDSFTFGWAVGDDEDYVSRLVQGLRASYPERRWEAINTGVPGYNTVMELETLKEKGLKYHPDIVIVGLVDNDLDLPNFIHDAQNYFSLTRSFALEYVARWRPDGMLLPAPTAADGAHFEGDPRKVPKQYRNMVGWDAFDRALAEFAELGSREHFELIVASFVVSGHPLMTRTLQASAQLGFHIVGVADCYERYLEKSQARRPSAIDLRDTPLARSHTDPHPSVLGHELAAQCILDYLRSHGILQKELALRAPG